MASEHLASEDQVEVHAETLRRWMLAEGLWSRERKHKAHRKRRERKAHFGELVQRDGSFENWLEGRGPYGCLMTIPIQNRSLVALTPGPSPVACGTGEGRCGAPFACRSGRRGLGDEGQYPCIST